MRGAKAQLKNTEAGKLAVAEAIAKELVDEADTLVACIASRDWQNGQYGMTEAEAVREMRALIRRLRKVVMP